MFDLARYRLMTYTGGRRPSAQSGTGESVPLAEHVSDRYEQQRSQQLAELEAAGKCLARPGKHENLRYWPADRGSRVLLEHRRRQRLAYSATRLA